MTGRRWPISTIAGALTIVVYVGCTLGAFVLYPLPFGVTTNYLSDLGNSISSPRGAIVYNVGTILAGVSLFPFFAGLVAWHSKSRVRTRLMIATQTLGFVEAFALVMIGVHPAHAGHAHVVWSNIQFLVNLFVLILATAALRGDPRFIAAIGNYGIVAIASQLAALVTIVIGHSSPFVEWLAVITTLLFVGLVAWNMSKPIFRSAA